MIAKGFQILTETFTNFQSNLKYIPENKLSDILEPSFQYSWNQVIKHGEGKAFHWPRSDAKSMAAL